MEITWVCKKCGSEGITQNVMVPGWRAITVKGTYGSSDIQISDLSDRYLDREVDWPYAEDIKEYYCADCGESWYGDIRTGLKLPYSPCRTCGEDADLPNVFCVDHREMPYIHPNQLSIGDVRHIPADS